MSVWAMNFIREIKRFLKVLLSSSVAIAVLMYMKSKGLTGFNVFYIEAFFIIMIFIALYRLIVSFQDTGVEAIIKNWEHEILMDIVGKNGNDGDGDGDSGFSVHPFYIFDKVHYDSKEQSDSDKESTKEAYSLIVQHIITGRYGPLVVDEYVYSHSDIGKAYKFLINGDGSVSIGTEIAKPDFKNF